MGDAHEHRGTVRAPCRPPIPPLACLFSFFHSFRLRNRAHAHARVERAACRSSLSAFTFAWPRRYFMSFANRSVTNDKTYAAAESGRKRAAAIALRRAMAGACAQPCHRLVPRTHCGGVRGAGGARGLQRVAAGGGGRRTPRTRLDRSGARARARARGRTRTSRCGQRRGYGRRRGAAAVLHPSGTSDWLLGRRRP